MKEKTILEIFAETVAKNTAEVADLEKKGAAVIRDTEKSLERTRAELTRERGLFEKLRGEYAGLEAAIENEVRAGLEQTEITKSKVQTGEASLSEFMTTGLSEDKLREKARAAAREKLAGATRLLREKSAKIYELEAAEAEAAYNISHWTRAVPRLRLEQMKKEAEDFGRALNPVMDAHMAAQNSNEKAKDNLRHAQHKHVFNILWDRLTVPEIQGLLFDARIPENLIPQVESFLNTADLGAIYRGVYKAMQDETGAGPYIAFTALGPK